MSGAGIADESTSNDDASKAHLFLIVLVYYAIITGVVIAVMACVAMPFVCHAFCLRAGRGSADNHASEINAADDATDGTSGYACNLREAGRVVCATLCWPVLVAVALGAALVELKAACRRCILPRRQREYTSDEANLDRSSTVTHVSSV